jgi:hypothetical protein
MSKQKNNRFLTLKILKFDILLEIGNLILGIISR